jgi:hypothetical protein
MDAVLGQWWGTRGQGAGDLDRFVEINKLIAGVAVELDLRAVVASILGSGSLNRVRNAHG